MQGWEERRITWLRVWITWSPHLYKKLPLPLRPSSRDPHHAAPLHPPNSSPSPSPPPQIPSLPSRRTTHPTTSFRPLPLSRNLPIRLLALAFLRRRRLARLERLLEIMNDVIDMFRTDRDTDQVLGDATVLFLAVGELLVRCGPGVDC